MMSHIYIVSCVGLRSQFRAMELSEAASAYAQIGHLAALQVLLQRHPAALWPHVIDVLCQLPESLHPRLYGFLLPTASGDPVGGFTAPWRTPDWVEAPHLLQRLAQHLAAAPPPAVSGHKLHRSSDDGVLNATEHAVLNQQGLARLPADAVARFYLQRALQIDESCGLLDAAAALLDLAVDRGVREAEIMRQRGLADVLATIALRTSASCTNASTAEDWEDSRHQWEDASSQAAPTAATDDLTASSHAAAAATNLVETSDAADGPERSLSQDLGAADAPQRQRSATAEPQSPLASSGSASSALALQLSRLSGRPAGHPIDAPPVPATAVAAEAAELPAAAAARLDSLQQEPWLMSLQEFGALAGQAKLALALRSSTEEGLEEDVQTLLLPLFLGPKDGTLDLCSLSWALPAVLCIALPAALILWHLQFK